MHLGAHMVDAWLRARRAVWALRYRASLAIASGLLYWLAFPGADQGYLAWICLVPALAAMDEATLSKRAIFGLGWLTGLVAHLCVYTWIVGLLVDFAYLPRPLALLGYLLLCLAQSSLFGAWALATHVVHARWRMPLVYAAPACMVLAELFYPALFPSYLANTQYLTPLFMQNVDVWGPLGLTFLLTFASAVLYVTVDAVVRRRRAVPWFACLVLLVMVGGSAAYGIATLKDTEDTIAHADKRVRVGLVQTNMGIYEKDDNPGEGLRRHREQSLEVVRQGAELVIWPESGYNYPIRTGATNVAESVLGPIRTPLLFGGLRVEPKQPGSERKLYNSSFLTDGAGNILGHQDKIYLLAFGEYLPLGELFPWLYELSPHSSHFSRGKENTPLTLNGISYGVLICYEDILPRFVRDVMQKQPDILVNLTNDAWFGKSHEPKIHLALSTLRAVEHRRFLVRATNTGISAVVDPNGRIVDQTPLFARANLVADIAALSGTTLYTLWGDWFAYLLIAVVAFSARADLRALVRRPTPGALTKKKPRAAA